MSSCVEECLGVVYVYHAVAFLCFNFTGNVLFLTETHYVPTSIKDVSQAPEKRHPVCQDGDEAKRATFAIKISIEHDFKTGRNQVLSTAAVSHESMQGEGLKVYDDGRKSVYALQSERDQSPGGAVEVMTPTQVEELLHQAIEEGVQYHQPVFSAPYMGTSRPPTPRTPTKSHLKDKTQCSQDLKEQTPPQIPQPDLPSGAKTLCCSTSGQNQRNLNLWSKFSQTSPPGSTFMNTDANSPNSVAPVQVTVRSGGTPAPTYGSPSGLSPSLVNHESAALIERSANSPRHIPIHPENRANTESITMVFMGYEDAADEEEGVQAEIVLITDSSDEDGADSCVGNQRERKEYLSYHPEGCKSKIFQPKMGVVKVSRDGDLTEEGLELRKPTFCHRSGKRSWSLQNQ
nr:palmdelphin [Nothobranchius furzeri]